MVVGQLFGVLKLQSDCVHWSIDGYFGTCSSSLNMECCTPSFSSVDEYIAAQPVETQARLAELRAIMRQIVPDATEVISYDMPTYKLGGRRVQFGAAKRHCALYGSAIHKFTNELRDFKTLKGT